MPNNNEIISLIRQTAKSILPKGSSLWLYGSRARGDNREDSDWDMIVLLDNCLITKDEKLDIACDFWERGQEVNQDFSTLVYTKDEWNSAPPSLFKYFIQNEAIQLWA